MERARIRIETTPRDRELRPTATGAVKRQLSSPLLWPGVSLEERRRRKKKKQKKKTKKKKQETKRRSRYSRKSRETAMGSRKAKTKIEATSLTTS